MKKLIGFLLLSACFAIDPVAIHYGFIDDAAHQELKAVRINAKVDVKVQSCDEVLLCQELNIDTNGHLNFSMPSTKGRANVVLKSATDVVITGRLSASNNVNLTIISDTFSTENANIEVANFTIDANVINIYSSTIKSSLLKIGNLATTSINFDETSTISSLLNKCSFTFCGEKLYAYGMFILAKTSKLNFYIENPIDFQNITVFNTDLRQKNSVTIDFFDKDCIGTPVSSDWSASCGFEALYDNYFSSLAYFISALLEQNHVTIKSAGTILINANIIPIIKSDSMLTLNAPNIELRAKIANVDLCLCNTKTSNMAHLIIGRKCSLHVNQLKLCNVGSYTPINLVDTTLLKANCSAFILSTLGKLETVHNTDSNIQVVDMPRDFILQKYHLYNSIHNFDPFLDKAKNITLSYIVLKSYQMVSLQNTTHLNLWCSYISLASTGALEFVVNFDSCILNVYEIKPGFALQSYLLNGKPKGVDFDRLFFLAKNIAIENTTVFNGLFDDASYFTDTFVMPELTVALDSLTVKNSRINCQHHLSAKNIKLKEAVIMGNYIATNSLIVDESRIILSQENVLPETIVNLNHSNVYFGSHFATPLFKAEHCNIGIGEFDISFKGDADSITLESDLSISFKEPFKNCYFGITTGKIIFEEGADHYITDCLSKLKHTNPPSLLIKPCALVTFLPACDSE